MTGEANPPRADFDGDAIRAAVDAAITGPLRTLVLYDSEGFTPVFVDESIRSLYRDEEQMLAHFETVHSYVHLDFMEIELFTDELFPVAGRVRYLTTGFDGFTFLRVYFGDSGLFMTLDRDDSPEKAVEAVERTVFD